MKIVAMTSQREIEDSTDPTSKTVVIASTDTPDRYGDIVDQQSWKLDRYKSNPIIQWGHRYDLPPIGKAHVGVHDGELLAEITWDTGEHNDLANTVSTQFQNGFLSAVSVGFMPGHAVKRSSLEQDDPRFAPTGMVYFDPELLEISAVPIPANPESLAQRGLPETAIIREIKMEIQQSEQPEVDQEDPEVFMRTTLKEEILGLINSDEEIRESICTLIYPEPEPVEIDNDALIRLLTMANDATD